jgi:hypothetical protein
MSAEDFGRVYVEIVELSIDRCQNVYGVSPCSASGAPGTECYNTFATCQDKVNFVRGTFTYRFCNSGAPLPRGVANVRPYIIKSELAPTFADPDQGLATRAKVSISLSDEPGSDVEQDPYVQTRAREARSTFWRLFIARTTGFAGRFARVRRGWVTPGPYGDPDYCSGTYFELDTGVFFDLSDDALIDELYTVDSITGPDAKGVVKLVLKDPIKLGDRVKIPVPTGGKLTSPITAAGLSFTVDSTDPSEYDKYGYPSDVLIEKEIVRVTSRSGAVFTIASLADRGRYNTIAAAHDAQSGVQLCRSWSSVAPTQILRDLLNEIGIADDNIDLDGFTEEANDWLGVGYELSPVLVKPDNGTTHIKNLVTLLNALMWWGNLDQKVRLKINAPAKHAENVTDFTDTSNIIEGTVKVTNLDDARITRQAVYYGASNPTVDFSKQESYTRGVNVIDEDAEDDNEFGDVRQDVIYAGPWFGPTQSVAATALAQRRLNWKRNVNKQIAWSVDPKDRANAHVGALARLSSNLVVQADGTTQPVAMRITKVREDGESYDIEGVTTRFAGRFCFISPNGWPDYLGATEAQRFYGFIANSTPTMSNGDEAYRIV